MNEDQEYGDSSMRGRLLETEAEPMRRSLLQSGDAASKPCNSEDNQQFTDLREKLLRGNSDACNILVNDQNETNDNLHLATQGSVMKKINRETILPSKQIEHKKEVMLDEDILIPKNSKSCWSFLCCCLKGKKTSGLPQLNLLNRIRRKTANMSSTLNIMEYLYLQYSQELVNILWNKQLEPNQNKLELRDDLSYWLIQFVYARVTSNYWISFNESDSDTINEIIQTICTSDIFYCHRMICFMMSNYFNDVNFEGVNEK